MASRDWVTHARAEKAALLEELRALLDETSKQKQLERQKAEDEANNAIMTNIPLPSPIYIL
jgi:transposase-like protein